MLFLTWCSKMLRLHPALDHVPGAFPARPSPVYRFGLALPGAIETADFPWFFGLGSIRGDGVKWNERCVKKHVNPLFLAWLGPWMEYETWRHDQICHDQYQSRDRNFGSMFWKKKTSIHLNISVNNIEQYTWLANVTSFYSEVPTNSSFHIFSLSKSCR